MPTSFLLAVTSLAMFRLCCASSARQSRCPAGARVRVLGFTLAFLRDHWLGVYESACVLPRSYWSATETAVVRIVVLFL